MAGEQRGSSKKILYWIFLIVFVWLAVTHFDQTKQVVRVLLTGKWYWIVMAIVCQIFYYPVYAKFVDYVFNIFDLKIGWREILPLTIATKFTDVALPVSTFGTIAVFIRHSRKKNLSTLNTGIAISFVLMFQIVAFSLIALLGFILLYFLNKVPAYMSVTFYIFLSLILAGLFIIARLSVDKTPPSRFVLWIIKLVAKMAGQKNVKIEEIEQIFLEIGADVKRNHKKIVPALYRGLIVHSINILTLGFVFLAFVGHINILAILTAYIGALLFTIVSITPQGVGVVETVMITALHSYGFDLPVATVITFAYRSLLSWLPVFAGFYFFSRQELKPQELQP